MARAVLENYALDVKRIRQMADDWNYIFRVDTTDGTRYVLRIGYPNVYSAQEARSEMQFIDWLAQQTAVPVVTPVPGKDGDLVYTAQVDGVPEARHCVLFEWITGADLGDDPSAATFEKMGAVAAQLHQHALAFTPPAGFQVETANTAFNPKDDVVLLAPQCAHLVSDAQRATFENAITLVEEKLAALYQQDGLRVIHNDLHQWNIMVQKGQPIVIDFEDLVWGYPIQDIGVTFYYLFIEDGDDGYDYARDSAAFKRGYESVAPWPVTDPRDLNIFIARRALDLVNFVVGSDDPEMQEFAPTMVARAVERIETLLG